MSSFGDNNPDPYGCRLGIRVHGFFTKEQVRDDGKTTYLRSLMRMEFGALQRRTLLMYPKVIFIGYFQPQIRQIWNLS